MGESGKPEKKSVGIISDKKQSFNGVSYYLCGLYYQNSKMAEKRLHRVVWAYHYGDIPKGFHVHHKDSNKANNDISNLEALSEHDHLSHHGSSEWGRELGRRYQERTKVWHASEEGRAWHREHYQNMKGKLHEKIDQKCSNCSESFSGIKRKGVAFCGRNCKASARRKSGIDNIPRECIKCGSVFEINRYSKTSKCRECSGR